MANDFRDDRCRSDDRDRFGYEGEGYIGRAGADMERDIRRYRGYGYESARDFEQRPPSFRGRGPKNYRRADPRIQEDVCERLTYDQDVDASEMEVSVLDGVVMLNGTVSDRYQKRRAEDILESIGGVKEVQNNLRVTRERR